MDRPLAPRPSSEAAPEAPVPRWVETLARVLDDAIVVPGTRLRFGVDAIIGLFVPAAGDAMTGVAAVALLFAALGARVPTVVLARMVINIGIDVLVGSIPILGDAFDVVWKANRANVELINHHARGGEIKARTGDYLLVGLGVTLAVAVVVVPLVVLAWLVAHVTR